MAGGIRESGLRWLWLPALIIALDQWSKKLIVGALQYAERIDVFPVLEITRLHNTGAAFSFLSDAGGWQRWFFVVLAIGVSLMIAVWLSRLPARGQNWLAVGLALILGGAIGNVIDRVRLGYVVDFIHAHWGTAYFPAFNVADSAITIGAACVIIDSLFFNREAAEPT